MQFQLMQDEEGAHITCIMRLTLNRIHVDSKGSKRQVVGTSMIRIRTHACLSLPPFFHAPLACASINLSPWLR